MKEFLKLTILLVAMVGYLFWGLVEQYTFIEFFYEKCLALAWLLVGVYFVIENDTFISRVFLIVVFNNLLDELIFNPFDFGINEKIFGIILIIMSYQNHKNQVDARRKR